jgi:hypothetical protein
MREQLREKLAIVEALLSRENLKGDGDAALRAAHPSAPAEMINTAGFHLFTDGIEAAVDWLVAVERFVRDPSKGLDYGATWHLIYHLYNWQQFQALLPHGREGMLELVRDVKTLLNEGDTEAAKRAIEAIEAILNGARQPPPLE